MTHIKPRKKVKNGSESIIFHIYIYIYIYIYNFWKLNITRIKL